MGAWHGGAYPLVGAEAAADNPARTLQRFRSSDDPVIHDACAAPDLHFDGTDLGEAVVHAAFKAALGDGYAEVVSTDELLS